MKKELIYAYCATNKEIELDEKLNCYFVGQDGLFAAVSRVPENEFGESRIKDKITDLTWLEDKARYHEEVIDNVMRSSSVVPFKFATLFNNEESLMNMLKEYIDTLLSAHRVEPNSDLGAAIKYMQKRWVKLTRFLTVAGAPLDNNIVETAQKKFPLEITKLKQEVDCLIPIFTDICLGFL